MATGNLFGTGGESNSLYGNSLSAGGSIQPSSFIYFEWFIFKTSASQPATPTGGSWDFLTNTGTAPTGWTNTVSGIPLDSLWFSIAFVDSRNPTNITWSEPGLISATESIYSTAYADTFTGDGVDTTFTLTQDPVVVNNLDVSINGVTQVPVVDYTISGTTFTTTTPAPLNSIILVKYRQALPNSYFGTANNVGYTPYNWIAATNVQAALDEVADDISAVDGVSGSNLVGYLPGGTGAVGSTVQDKLRETVSVKDFGAVGDGVTDDRTAINAAFSAVIAAGGGTLFFPKGTYYISDYIGNTDYAGNTQTVNIAVLGEPGTVIDCNPAVYGNYALYLRFQDAPIITVKNLYVDCNTKVATGIACTSVTSIEIAQVDSCEVRNCHAINNAGVTTSVQAISVASTGWGYTAKITNCVVQNVTRDKTGLACQAVVITGVSAAWVENNSISNVSHDGTDRVDADGIVVFSQQDGSGNYQKSVATIINNHIRNCEGRFIKLQTNGQALVSGNYMGLSGSLDLIDNWRGVDSQVGDATIINNTIRIGTGWTGATSGTMFVTQPPLLANQDYANEGFFQRVIGNNVEVRQKVPYFCIPAMPSAGVTANHYVEIANNIANFPTTLNTATQADVAFTDFVYLSSGPSVADTNGQVTWRIYGNQVFSYNFIRMDYTQADYTNKWYFYVYDNFKPSIGYNREIFYSGATAPYTNTCMIRDNMVGQIAGQMTWPLDLSKILNGCDFYSGSQTMTSVPAAYTNSRVYKHGGMWGVQRSNQWYISGDTTTWTALV